MKPSWELDPERLRKAVLRRIERSSEIQADLAFSAIPALFEHYAGRCEALFELAARPLEGQQRAHFRNLLGQALKTGFEASAHAKVVLRVRSDPAPRQTISYEIGIQTREIADVYATWLRTPDSPYFGAHADAKVLHVARELRDPNARALDIGAGTGRNALPLAKLGLTVDAVELTPGFVEKLRDAAAAADLRVNAIEGDAFDPELALPPGEYALVVASEVASSHLRDGDDLREFLEFAASKLKPGGVLVCNVFIARAGYSPDLAVRQAAPSVLSTIFSDADLAQAQSGLPLSLVSDESCLEFEKAHLPGEAWPPTAWFESWASGNNLFDLTGVGPCELRWLVYRKT